jgi:short-subunit dehydrogenase
MNKTVLITGATSGLGLAYARYFAKKGYDLVITGRREEVINQNANNIIETFGVNVKVIIVDLSENKGVDFLMENIKELTIDILINNAGFGLKPTFAETDINDINKLLYLQTACVTRLTHFVLQDMKKRNEGTIINISSDGAFAVIPHNVLYSSTKLFIVNFTEGLYLELIGSNIQVQVVCPGFINSHFHENAQMKVDKTKKGLGQFRNPEDVVKDAMLDLQKGKVVSVPDKSARRIKNLSKILPRKIFYRILLNATKKFSGKK